MKFKVGDWVYAERLTDLDDYRESQHIPVFQIKQLDIQGKDKTLWLRPVSNDSTGIRDFLCRLALPHEIPLEYRTKRIKLY